MHAEVDDKAVLGKSTFRRSEKQIQKVGKLPQNIVEKVDQGQHGGPSKSVVEVVWPSSLSHV
jgi:hypothetical protein